MSTNHTLHQAFPGLIPLRIDTFSELLRLLVRQRPALGDLLESWSLREIGLSEEDITVLHLVILTVKISDAMSLRSIVRGPLMRSEMPLRQPLDSESLSKGLDFLLRWNLAEIASVAPSKQE